MSSIDSTYSSTSRITGLFSDMDTDSLVESMCSTQQSKIDASEKKLQTYEWYTDALDEVVSSVKEFSNTYCSTLGSASMLKSAAYSSFSVTSDSTGSAVSLTASNSAQLGDYSVKVTQLAENANISSSGRISSNGVEISANNTTALGELSFANDLAFGDGGNISFMINGVKFKFSRDTTLQGMINTINNDEEAGVTMKYSRLTDAFTITADSGGADSSVSIANISGNAFGADSAFMINETNVRNGCDSVAEINGTVVTRDSNAYTIDGVGFELNKVTGGTDEEYVNFRVGRDYSATVDTVASFVDALNTLLTKLDSLTSAKDNSYDYPPLTDAQKEEMSDEEIAAWETKAKSGIFHNNSDLEQLVSNLKKSFFSAAGGTGSNATAIGITSASYYDTSKGLLVVDTDALTKALEKNPETVIAMFTGGNSASSSSDMGIIYKIKSALSAYQGTAKDSIDLTKDKMDDLESGISTLEDRLDEMADSYYKKFSAMETALSTLNSQASYISALFSS